MLHAAMDAAMENSDESDVNRAGNESSVVGRRYDRQDDHLGIGSRPRQRWRERSRKGNRSNQAARQHLGRNLDARGLRAAAPTAQDSEGEAANSKLEQDP